MLRLISLAIACAISIGLSPASSSAAGLAQPAGKAGCVNAEGDQGCARGRGFEYGAAAVVSPDGRNVYAVSTNGEYGAIAAFKRDKNTGELTQLEGTAGCLSPNGRVDSAVHSKRACAKATG